MCRTPEISKGEKEGCVLVWGSAQKAERAARRSHTQLLKVLVRLHLAVMAKEKNTESYFESGPT